jgi:hypothetical protein
VGERDQVAGEAVAAEVAALPHLLGVGRRERGGEWPSAFGTAPVVPAVGADEEQGVFVCVESYGRTAAERFDVELQRVGQALERCRLDPRWFGPGADRQTPHTASILSGCSASDEQRANKGRVTPGADLCGEPCREAGIDEGVLAPRPGMLQEQPRTDDRRRPGHGFATHPTLLAAALRSLSHGSERTG